MNIKNWVGALSCAAMLMTVASVAQASNLGVRALPLASLPAAGRVIPAPAGHGIDGQYIVVFKPSATPLNGLAAQALSRVGGQVLGSLPIINAVVMQIDALSARLLAANRSVAYVEQDQWLSAGAVQANPPWGLDRVDQSALPVNGSYTYPDGAGAGANVYVIDTGIRTTHAEFTGRIGGGRNFVASSGPLTLPIPLLGTLSPLGGGSTDPNNFADCNGHGTHVSGTAVGTQYGVAKKARVHAIRVLGCDGSGPNSGVIAGVEWVANNHVKPAVANLSLGGSASTALDDAVRAAIRSGVVMVTSAGNDNANACGGSPNRVPEALTVAASDAQDRRASFSNSGTCVDLFAPGVGVISAWHTGDTAANTLNGTSMAAPHVAGAVALLLAQGAPSDVVAGMIVSGATPGRVQSAGTGSPNLLLRTAAP
ncbi:MAG: S8 family peptidase [Panacagrimonas sp.]